ncbi:MAG: PmeII family type II restriction endonuclease [Ginsengibacter sp.]
MEKLNLPDVLKYVEENIGIFHNQRLENFKKLKLKIVLRKKNPYLFKAKNVNTATEIIQGIVDAFLSSSEEGIFGNWLERFAIYINDSVFKGRKAGIDGIDLDFDRNDSRYLVAIKSGPSWGNDSQIKKLIDQFNTARKRLHTSGSKIKVVCVNGCCYGRLKPSSEYKSNGDYNKICGQKFWELISGDPNLYITIVEPLGMKAKEKNEEFKDQYSRIINQFTKEFLIDFCKEDGSIDWEKLVRFNSSIAE